MLWLLFSAGAVWNSGRRKRQSPIWLDRVYAYLAMIIIFPASAGLAAGVMTPSNRTPALTNDETAYVVEVVWSIILLGQCEGFEIQDSPFQFADRIGIGRRITIATRAALLVNADKPYNAADLISDVTVVVRKAVNMMDAAITENRAKACKMAADHIVGTGLVRRK